MKQNQTSIKKMAVTAALCALSFGATLLGQVIPPVAGFLSYDPKDAVVAIAGFLFGPGITVAISLIVSLVEMVSISTTGIYGMIMNFLSTMAFAFPASFIYRKKRSYSGAFLGLSVGVVFMTACMILWNYIFTPFYMGAPRAAVAEMLIPIFLPFNLIKGGINAGLTLVLYKPLVTALRRAHLVSVNTDKGGERPYRSALLWIGLALLTVSVFAFLFFSGVL